MDLLIACHSCDALLRVSDVEHAVFRCTRCDAVVHRATQPNRQDHALAFSTAAAFSFLIANAFPIVAINSGSETAYATLVGAALALSKQGMNAVACVVAATTFFIPAIELGCTLALLLLARSGRFSPSLAILFRARKALRPWSMVEIFVLGALVAIVKLGSLASVILGAGIWSLGAFIVLNAAAAQSFDVEEFWNTVGSRG